MTSHEEEVRATLTERYGIVDPGTRRRRRLVLVTLAAVVVVAFVVLAVVSTDRPIRTEDAGFRVVDDAAVEVTFLAHMDPGTTAECTVLALNDAFAQVGVRHVPVGPAEQRTTIVTAVVATTEPATGARVSGCRETTSRGG